MGDNINFNNINGLTSNNNQKNNEIFEDPFNSELQKMKNKLNSLLNNKNNKSIIDSSNNLQKIIDNNLYINSIYKSKKIDLNINDAFLPPYKEDNINIKDTNDKLFNINKMDKNNISEKQNESTRYIFKPHIHVNNILFINNNSSENLDKITSHINLPNNNYDNLKLLENKRKRNDSIVDTIYTEIKGIYNNYKNKNKNSQGISIYEKNKGYLEKNETVIIDEKPICVIYLKENRINKIYLISEEAEVTEHDTIINILNQIKQDISGFIQKKKI